MSDLHHERFDLSRFVLEFLEQQGGVVAPPAFGAYEVLLPEELAAHLGIDDSQHPRFDTQSAAGAGEDALHLSVNHPLVDAIAAQVASQPASATVHISHVRVEKRGLVELARKSFSLPNARLDFTPNTQEHSELHHYLQFNFKVTFLSEEKQEELESVMMDVQAGHAVTDPAHLRQLTVTDSEPAFEGFPAAQPRWIGAGAPLAVETLQALLLRAEAAVRVGLSGRLTNLTARMAHHLALDLARIEEYYDELARDLRKRQARLDADDSARRQEFDDKLAMLENERHTKAEDVRGRYGLRVELELVNTLLIAQPKVTIPLSINNRTTTIQRTVVWDPLLHRLEPLVCDVCGQPGDGLQLCTNGHLAHDGCLAPQCVDCKRVYCALCSEQIKACAVCGRPVCRQSLIACPTCARGTCREHQGLCHAANGQPAVFIMTPPAKSPEKPPEKTTEKLPEKPVNNSPLKTPTATARDKPKTPFAKQTPVKPAPKPIGVRLDVQVFDDKPLIAAFVMRSARHVLATRIIEMAPSGVSINCRCEKLRCPADGYIYRPAPDAHIAAQVAELLEQFQTEYRMSTNKVHYLYMRNGNAQESSTLVLPPIWRDAKRLAEARAGFDRI